LSSQLVITLLILYFGTLLVIAYFTSRNADSETFFTAKKSSPWYLVAFGMIGTTISGVTFISVPGGVGAGQFAYFQVILGNLIGYVVVTLVLLPLYYKLNLISIYTYLEKRFGFWSYKTGSFFFLLSRTIGAAVRLFLAVLVLQLFLFKEFNVPFPVVVLITLGLIWVYTFRGGVKTIIWTDSLQTLFLIAALIMSLIFMAQKLTIDNPSDLISAVAESKYSKIFFFEDINSKNYFWKKFLSGIFLVIAMVGLDQDLMQKNLTCKNIGEAQKNMFSFVGVFLLVNVLFLSLGALLYLYTDSQNIPIPERSDYLYPTLAFRYFGVAAGVFFLLGITASSYASSDSALAALTTAFCIDFLEFEKKDEATRQRLKFWVHLGFSVLLFIIILIFNALNNKSAVDAIFKIAGYTYGPLLGMFSFGMLSKRGVKDKFVPFVCIISPLVCWLLDTHSVEWFNGYKFDFELLLVNGLLTFVGMLAISKK
jgi:Na+/proline symporter